ncbi:MerR family transcriptional regulator [Roseobacter sinensis]|uniref:MerR family transcriptional regulator n=1 Tax=Roseobacter sinensis TaxID=2931391 RepID=A0ABT3BIB5_9RHOB|nr:MerR family transcriptional regulator [Roseobacter sp. WL0113]MCV3273311.1 MerR family transcriptional regulator [Roseobacter sp. WL0113]
MRISEAATASGLRVDTIRYYEATGLVPKVARGSDGHRRFSPENVEWLSLLYWLRETGMPMKVMKRFAELYAAGNETIPERKAILMDHSKLLQMRRENLDRCEDVLARKLEIYEDYLT